MPPGAKEASPVVPAGAPKPMPEGTSAADTQSATIPAPAVDVLWLADTIADAIDAVSDETGWAGLGAVGSTITKLRPDFDSRLYGHRKFSDLVRSMPGRFELEERSTGTGKSLFVRLATRADAKTRSGKTPRKRKEQ